MLKVNIQTFKYPDSEREILSEISFQLLKGEHLAVMGESGCGKSTLLHLIYGLFNLQKGTILYDDQQLFGPSHNLVPGHSFMTLLAQDNTLMPFTSVDENVREQLSRMNTEEDNHRVNEVLETVGLLEFKNRKVQSLSGGQKQRVALAKALAKAPEVILLDEPFSSIDTFRKNHLRRTLFHYLKKQNITCITATHDAEEALSFSDRLLFLKGGSMLQLGPAVAVYNKVTSLYEKGFFGEVSVIPAGVFSEKEMVLLAHELRISTEKTNLKVSVVTSYFKGGHYLIEAVFRRKNIFFYHPEALNKTETYLQLKK